MPSPLDQPQTDTPIRTPDEAITSSSARNAETLAIEYAAEEQSKKEDKIHSLDLGEGNVVKLDALGPMIVNSDGTLSRIQNWHELSPNEQERTVRLLVKKRNLVRLKKLDDEERAGGREEGQEVSALQEEGQEVSALQEGDRS